MYVALLLSMADYPPERVIILEPLYDQSATELGQNLRDWLAECEVADEWELKVLFGIRVS